MDVNPFEAVLVSVIGTFLWYGCLSLAIGIPVALMKAVAWLVCRVAGGAR